MNDRELQTACLALKWEARYRKGEHLSGKGAFLPVMDALDPDFAQAIDQFAIKSGKLLDIGTGMSIQARHFSRLGFQVTATDVSANWKTRGKMAGTTDQNSMRPVPMVRIDTR